MKIEKIKFLVKQVRYQEVEVSESNGFPMPSEPIELVDFVKQIEFAPESFTSNNEWHDEEFELSNMKITEAE